MLVIDRIGSLLAFRLHYPADVSTIAKGLNLPMDLSFVHNVPIIVEKLKLVYIDYKNKLGVQSMKKPELVEFTRKHNIPVTGITATVPNLKRIITVWLKENPAAATSTRPCGIVGKSYTIRDILLNDVVRNPTAVCSVDNETVFVCNKEKIFQISFPSRYILLCG